MTLIPCSARHALKFGSRRSLRVPLWTHLQLISLSHQKFIHQTTPRLALQEKPVTDTEFWTQYKGSFDVPKPTFKFDRQIPLNQIGQTVSAVGFLGKRKDMNEALSFTTLFNGTGPGKVQIISQRGNSEAADEAHHIYRRIRTNSAVSVTGILSLKYEPKKPGQNAPESADEGYVLLHQIEIRLESVKCVNSFPADIPVFPGHIYPPKSRHLQIRFDPALRERLQFRSDVAAYARKELADFQEVETPILFKSTPEGAREFLVPTRRLGYAYALPQSPQQYKQILMASGIHKYVQFAKCFRDEDLRADRQPEFTQIDLEMAWANGEAVMERVEKFIKSLYRAFAKQGTAIQAPLPETPFIQMSYVEAMSKHGSDKPDLRIQGLIHRIDSIIPANLRDMLTSIQDPIVETFKIRLNGTSSIAQKFIRQFMGSPDAEIFRQNPDGAPGIFVFDARRPLEGLQAFGFEGAENLKALYAMSPKQLFVNYDHDTATTFDDGDLLLVQARENLPHTGGSTILGKLRIAIYKAAVAEGLIDPDPSHNYLWVTDFPMFTLENAADPGQGGAAGFSATHHPFTAPKSAADVDLLLTDPLKAKADHYDLVVNGVELGGGSRRIHSAEMQKFIMRDILKMPEKRIDDFEHLFEALRAGCPPHAGLAIGFDRLIAVMQGRESVKDVIAFPKSSKGDDMMIKSPSRLTTEQLERYHLQVRRSRTEPGPGDVQKNEGLEAEPPSKA